MIGKIKELDNTDINMDYWEKSVYNYSKLALFFLDAKMYKEDAEWEGLFRSYKETREKYGSIGKKKAEAYNLILILNALDMLKKDKEGNINNKHGQILKTKIALLKLE